MGRGLPPPRRSDPDLDARPQPVRRNRHRSRVLPRSQARAGTVAPRRRRYLTTPSRDNTPVHSVQPVHETPRFGRIGRPRTQLHRLDSVQVRARLHTGLPRSPAFRRPSQPAPRGHRSRIMLWGLWGTRIGNTEPRRVRRRRDPAHKMRGNKHMRAEGLEPPRAFAHRLLSTPRRAGRSRR